MASNLSLIGELKLAADQLTESVDNFAANHRANDLLIKEGAPQIIGARFMYGPLDMITLTGEKVDIYVMKDAPVEEWTLIATEVTDKTSTQSVSQHSRRKGSWFSNLPHEDDCKEHEVVVHVAYGSSKDIGVYTSIGLKPKQIFIVGKFSTSHGGSRPAQGNARMVIPRPYFGLPGHNSSVRRRR